MEVKSEPRHTNVFSNTFLVITGIDVHLCTCQTGSLYSRFVPYIAQNNFTDLVYVWYRLASPVDGILLNDLKITNIIERKKIALRAMDVVLFGAPRSKAIIFA